MTPLAILGSDASRELDERLGGLASFFGVDSQRVEVCASSSPEGLASQLGPEVQGVGLSAATACLLQARLQSPEALLAVLAGHGRQIFAYGFEPSPQHDQAAQWLSRGAVRRIVPAGQPGPWEWPAAGRPFTRQLAGSQFDRAARASDCGFELDEAGGSVTVLARAAGRPVFARAGDVGGGLFLWASPGMASLDQPVPEAEGMGGLYESVLPVVVYLRSAFPGATWENPAPTARVIIDDPLLGARYGFLDYTQLARSLETLDYALTIAFIPWNHRRTSRAGAGLVRAAAGRLSVCLHGCDHTRNEFGALDGPLLEQKTWLAVQRMNWHQEQTGLPFDNVMVFPQGRFSRAAVSALRRCGCLAAVNTTRAPVDGAQDRLTLADELMPAASRYSGFPIFHRRYPKQAGHFAIDLFLGKPAHIVEHHEVFEHGCQTLETTVRALKALEPRLAWPGLAAALEQTHVRRLASGSAAAVRFFTSAFRFETPANGPLLCMFEKPEPDPARVQAVRVNGQSVPFEARSASVEFQLSLQPGQKLAIEILDHGQPAGTLFSPGLVYRVKTRARRHLSEFRDNHLARRPWLLKAAKSAVRLLKASADSTPGGHPTPG